MNKYWLHLVLRHILFGMLFASFTVMLLQAFWDMGTFTGRDAIRFLVFGGWIGLTVMIFEMEPLADWPVWQARGLHFLIVIISTFVMNWAFVQYWLSITITTILMYALNLFLSDYLLRHEVTDVNAKITALKNRQ